MMFGRRFLPPFLLASLLLASACAGRPQAAPRSSAEPPPGQPTDAELSDLEKELWRTKEALVEAQRQNQELRRRLAGQEVVTVRAQEANASLEAELAEALDELLRANASIRGIESRAFATSRIAELGVLLESMPEGADPEVDHRLKRARSFLERADEALAEGNFGGAAYLAERAGELLQQAKMVGLIRESSDLDSSEIVPIVPSRLLVVVRGANLRNGPGLQSDQIGTVAPGAELLGLARSRGWYQVRLDSGRTAWIHSSLVRDADPEL